ncbi:hypothetical protein PCASD_02998 [Puccinia coronata f. sp. avenae]|uniref:Uncharacterized protein n=1 Tax=Puccinia coronata f. sp. avenae TaxID=200324 RepID=A0A2N5VGK6_9BASI|nr:hypothetical protein PCASD_02998 [Puccinia coronata f. sp. avenae]
MSIEHLELWCRELLKISENHPTGNEMSIIMHGFHTLILKNSRKDDVHRKLGSYLGSLEIIAPHTGLSKALLLIVLFIHLPSIRLSFMVHPPYNTTP